MCIYKYIYIHIHIHTVYIKSTSCFIEDSWKVWPKNWKLYNKRPWLSWAPPKYRWGGGLSLFYQSWKPSLTKEWKMWSRCQSAKRSSVCLFAPRVSKQSQDPAALFWFPQCFKVTRTQHISKPRPPTVTTPIELTHANERIIDSSLWVHWIEWWWMSGGVHHCFCVDFLQLPPTIQKQARSC